MEDKLRLFVWADLQGPVCYIVPGLVWGIAVYVMFRRGLLSTPEEDRTFTSSDVRFAAFAFGAFWFITFPLFLVYEARTRWVKPKT